MSPKSWLLKTEPEEYSWKDLVKEGIACWDGVRNKEAAKHLRSMQENDRLVIYHTGKFRCAVGTGHIVKTAYPDPTATEDGWVAVDIAPDQELPSPITLTTMRTMHDMKDCILLRRQRLSVVPLTDKEYEAITLNPPHHKDPPTKPKKANPKTAETAPKKRPRAASASSTSSSAASSD